MNTRGDLVTLLRDDPIGIELGVARGRFSHQLTKDGLFKEFYSIDKWDDHHNVAEYLFCVKTLTNCTVIRSTFKEALVNFDDEYFDFIYIDGYAHLGQEGGDTLTDWYPKLKEGGIFAGHDYDERWPKTIASVDSFCDSVGKEVSEIEGKSDSYAPFNSWYIEK